MKKKILIFINLILGVGIICLVGLNSCIRSTTTTVCKYGVPSEIQQSNDSLQQLLEQIEQEGQRKIDSLKNLRPDVAN